MNGHYLVSESGAVCGACGRRIRIGGKVWYDGSLLDNANRRCETCVDLDLFGATA